MLLEEECQWPSLHLLLILFKVYRTLRIPNSQGKTVKYKIEYEPPADSLVVSSKEQDLRRINRHRPRLNIKPELHRFWLLLRRVQPDVVNVYRS